MSLVPSGSDSASDMTRVWPADTAAGGISFLAADLGSVGALVGADGLVGTASTQSLEMGNWTGDRSLVVLLPYCQTILGFEDR